MNTILFFSSASRHSCRKRVAGVQRFFTDTDAHVQIVEGNYQQVDVCKLLDFWQPVGCIAECGSDTDNFKPSSFGRVPTVYLDKDPDATDGVRFSVSADLAGSAHLAAKELLSLDLPHYGFVGFKLPFFWSRQRETAFRAAIELNGKPCHVFQPPPGATDLVRLIALRDWLKALPKPCGLFAAFDGTAEEVLAACRQEEIAVPTELVVLGVDNNEEICEATQPTLSSICPDFEEAGFLCGELLARQLANPKAPPESRTFGLLGVIRRQSTNLRGKTDPKVTHALEFIRRHACEGIKVADVARSMGCSKRTAEMRFSRLLKRTIADEIRSVRLDRVFALLRKPNQAIAGIANLCGYESDSTLRYAFKAHTGLSMREWRQQQGYA